MSDFPDPFGESHGERETQGQRDGTSRKRKTNKKNLHANRESLSNDINDIWEKVSDFIDSAGRRSRKGRKGGSSGLMRPMVVLIGLIGLVGLWFGSGFYRVLPDEQGVVMRFGQYARTTYEGLNYHLPYPIEVVYRPKVTRVNQIVIGMTTQDSSRRGVTGDIPDEPLMLTGDENIADVDFRVFWIIKDAPAYLFNVYHPEFVLKSVAESIMRSVVGQHFLQDVLTGERQLIESTVREQIQKVVDHYGLGVEIQQVKMQKSDPPDAVIASFRDVQAARADQERARNEAKLHSNKIIPEAKGKTATIVQEAEAYRYQAIAQGQGEAERFLSIYREYLIAPNVTRQRLYLETMEDLLSISPKIIVQKETGVLPYLPLEALKQKEKQ